MDRMTNTVRPYAWGSRTAIPALLGVEPTGEPQAELWMGAHPGSPSLVDRGAGAESLAALIEAAPEAELGAATLERFGPRLPFLLKVLAAGEPLSLQVHPDLDQAREGFADEERRGVPLDASHRNYKDANHKPEMIVALDDFDGLCGFREPAATAELLEALGVPALAGYAEILRGKPEEEALREVFTAVLTAEPEATAATVTELVQALQRVREEGTPRAAALTPVTVQGYLRLAEVYPQDAGVIAALLLNVVRLTPGQGLYLGAGVPHAYIEGLGVEIMANSDNVLRSGLTPKHVDVPELLRIVRFQSGGSGVIDPRPVPGNADEELYPAPIEDFRLSRFTLAEGAEVSLQPGTPQILLCTEGTVTLAAQGGQLELTLRPGESAFVPAVGPEVTAGVGRAADSDRAVLFRATVPA
jgi:mannose-6-phosphate isomerase